MSLSVTQQAAQRLDQISRPVQDPPAIFKRLKSLFDRVEGKERKGFRFPGALPRAAQTSDFNRIRQEPQKWISGVKIDGLRASLNGDRTGLYFVERRGQVKQFIHGPEQAAWCWPEATSLQLFGNSNEEWFSMDGDFTICQKTGQLLYMPFDCFHCPANLVESKDSSSSSSSSSTQPTTLEYHKRLPRLQRLIKVVGPALRSLGFQIAFKPMVILSSFSKLANMVQWSGTEGDIKRDMLVQVQNWTLLCDGILVKHLEANLNFRTPEGCIVKWKAIHTVDLIARAGTAPHTLVLETGPGGPGDNNRLTPIPVTPEAMKQEWKQLPCLVEAFLQFPEKKWHLLGKRTDKDTPNPWAIVVDTLKVASKNLTWKQLVELLSPPLVTNVTNGSTTSHPVQQEGRKRVREETESQTVAKRAKVASSLEKNQEVQQEGKTMEQSLEPLFELWRRNPGWELETHVHRPALTGEHLTTIVGNMHLDEVNWKQVGTGKHLEHSVDFCYQQRPSSPNNPSPIVRLTRWKTEPGANKRPDTCIMKQWQAGCDIRISPEGRDPIIIRLALKSETKHEFQPSDEQNAIKTIVRVKERAEFLRSDNALLCDLTVAQTGVSEADANQTKSSSFEYEMEAFRPSIRPMDLVQTFWTTLHHGMPRIENSRIDSHPWSIQEVNVKEF